jgi:hypothetical protein
MPIIIQGSPEIEPVVIMAGAGDLFPDGSVQQQLRVIMAGLGDLIPNGSSSIAAGVVMAGFGDLIPDGRLNDDANEFGSVIMAGVGQFLPNGVNRIGGLCLMSGAGDLFPSGRVVEAPTGEFQIFLTVAAEPNAGFGQRISARIFADGIAYRIKAASYDEDENDFGVSVNFTLQKPSDRAAILAASEFQFDIYDGAWKTMFTSGKRIGAGYSFAIVEGRPNDVLSVSTTGNISEKAERSPLVNTTIYDPVRSPLTAQMFQPIKDTNGNTYVQDLIPIADLDLEKLLRHVIVNLCGFSDVQSFLPNHKIRRADFSQKGTFFEGLNPHLGSFEPIIFVREDLVYILDSTAAYPESFGSPMALHASQTRGAEIQRAELNADGYEVTFADNDSEFDYTDIETVADDEPSTVGESGDPDYTETTVTRKFKRYWKTSQPFTPIRREKIEEVTETSAYVNGTFRVVENQTETIRMDSMNRSQSATIETENLIALLEPGFPLAMRTTHLVEILHEYRADRFDPRKYFLWRKTERTSVLCAIDSDNLHLDQPFIQEYGAAMQGGNLTEGMSLQLKPAQTLEELSEQNERGQIEFRTRVWTFLTTPPTKRVSPVEIREGDQSGNAQTGTPKHIIVLREEAPRTNAKLLSMSVMELPPEFAIPLALRKLAKTFSETGSIPLKGINLTFERGVTFELFERDGTTSLGRYIVTGRSIAFADLGSPRQATRMTLQVKGI